MTSSQHALTSWATRTYNVGTKVARASELIPKPASVQIAAETACMKGRVAVTAGQHTAVNTFPALYTPPVPWKLVTPEVAELTRTGGRRRGWTSTGAKSYKVAVAELRLDTSFL